MQQILTFEIDSEPHSPVSRDGNAVQLHRRVGHTIMSTMLDHMKAGQYPWKDHRSRGAVVDSERHFPPGFSIRCEFIWLALCTTPSRSVASPSSKGTLRRHIPEACNAVLILVNNAAMLTVFVKVDASECPQTNLEAPLRTSQLPYTWISEAQIL